MEPKQGIADERATPPEADIPTRVEELEARVTALEEQVKDLQSQSEDRDVVHDIANEDVSDINPS